MSSATHGRVGIAPEAFDRFGQKGDTVQKPWCTPPPRISSAYARNKSVYRKPLIVLQLAAKEIAGA